MNGRSPTEAGADAALVEGLPEPAAPLPYRHILRFWLPLAATWLMMAIEGPFLSAVIARLPEPKYNLAAYGVAYALALLIEAPVIMLMSAATALVQGRESFARLRRFTYALCGLVTAAMLVLLVPSLFTWLAEGAIGLPPEVASLTYRGILVLLPWPAAIGYRRFYQGLLIRYDQTRRVAYGTGVRLVTMTATAVMLYTNTEVPGVLLGASALSAGVMAEAVATRLMSGSVLRRLRTEDAEVAPPSYRTITRFYVPLALTSLIGLGVQPLVTFLMGQSLFALESLAVFPVVSALVFLFRSMGLAWQEVGIALLGPRNENYVRLRNFALVLGLGASTGLALVAFTPLFTFWYRDVSGLSETLVAFAGLPTRLLVLLPALTVLLSFERALVVNSRRTTSITMATALEVATIVGVLALGVYGLDLVGVTAAAAALFVGRMVANLYLLRPAARALRAKRESGS